MFEDGRGLKKDESKARAWYRKAAEQGHVDSMFRLARSFFLKWSDRTDQKEIDEALGQCRKAAEYGNEEARKLLPMMEAVAKAVEIRKNMYDDEAFHADFFEKVDRRALEAAAKNGCPEACLLLWRLNDPELGLLSNPKAAFDWCRLGAESGDRSAVEKLASLYVQGKGVEKNKKEAIRLLRGIGGNGMLRSIDPAYDGYKKYLENHHRVEISSYPSSDEFSREDIDSVISAAEAGDDLAWFLLGRTYDPYDGAREDAAKAIYWYRKVAEKENAFDNLDVEAQYFLGRIYKKDLAPERNKSKNRAEAIQWLRKAAENGHEDAKSELKYLLPDS
jgi:TPR repeat protein